MASVENMPLTGGLLLGRKRMSWPTLSTGWEPCWRSIYRGFPHKKGLSRARPWASAARAFAAHCCIPSPHLVRLREIARSADNKAGSGNGLWNKTRQRLFKRIINPREGDWNEPKQKFVDGNAPQIPQRCGSGQRGRGCADGRESSGPHQHAVAEHLAVEGHFPRVCERLRQEGQRYDRRRSEDRSVAGRRRGARFPAARCRFERRARWRSRRARLSLR